jgi:hypothetical protein
VGTLLALNELVEGPPDSHYETVLTWITMAVYLHVYSNSTLFNQTNRSDCGDSPAIRSEPFREKTHLL